MKDPTIYFLKQLIEYKKERIEEIEKDSRKSWSSEVVENLEKDIYGIEAIIDEREVANEAIENRKSYKKS